MTDAAVLIVEDDAELRKALCHTLDTGEYPVISVGSGPEALSILASQSVGLVVSDIQMEPMTGRELLGRIRQEHPTMPAVLMTAYGTIENAVDVMRDGAADYLVKPFAASELMQVVDRHMRVPAVNDLPVAADDKTVELLRIAGRVAGSDATVTLSGDSGTGKEVFARYIHQQSKRRDKPFVAINCAAIPENMLEAILFGHEKGAFTGASMVHAGKFEQANGGTLLLDEISEMELGLQAKILRVIQEREVERIGGKNTIALDVRVLATTNRDLQQHVKDGLFREDLYYRLNVFPLHIPPLRERQGDIVPLAESILAELSRSGGPVATLSDCAKAALRTHAWPGNVRELHNLLQRTLIMLSGKTVTAAELAFEAVHTAESEAVTESAALEDDLRKSEFRLIVDALRDLGGNRAATAAKLGISPRTLRYKLARMRQAGLSLPHDICSTTH